MRTTALFTISLLLALAVVGCDSQSGSSNGTAAKPADSKPSSDPVASAAPAEKDLKKDDVKPGTGPAVENGDTVVVLYKGSLKKDGKEFDSNMGADKAPFNVVVGSGSVIKGWDLGLLGMKEGGERKLTIPSALAYGEAGSPPNIGPNEDLVFDIQLLFVVKKGHEAEYTKKIIKEGTGEGAKNGDKITVHYIGTLLNGKKFDSSRDRNQPFEVTLGAHQVISGWDPGLVGIKKGERRIMKIPPAAAYGEKDQGTIPPNSVLQFDIECLDIKRG